MYGYIKKKHVICIIETTDIENILTEKQNKDKVMEFSAKQIAEYIHGEIVGNENATVHTFAKIEEGVPGAISFLSNPKYTHYIYTTQSTIVQ